jgi:hypothetical protein
MDNQGTEVVIYIDLEAHQIFHFQMNLPQLGNTLGEGYRAVKKDHLGDI